MEPHKTFGKGTGQGTASHPLKFHSFRTAFVELFRWRAPIVTKPFSKIKHSKIFECLILLNGFVTIGARHLNSSTKAVRNEWNFRGWLAVPWPVPFPKVLCGSIWGGFETISRIGRDYAGRSEH